VTEYADGGSLWDLMGGETNDETRLGLDERTVRELATAILDGLAVLHENSIVHRDLKPQNILRCDDTWKIADFGISKLINNPTTGYTFQGAHTAPWAPPEQITGAPAHPSADVYALGRVMCFLLTGSRAPDAQKKLPPHWQPFVNSCLEYNPSSRPTIAELREQLAALPCPP
jgi:serine/threonine-protein kinase